jgi:ankyrin repeat protein
MSPALEELSSTSVSCYEPFLYQPHFDMERLSVYDAAAAESGRGEDSVLLSLIESYEWAAVLARVATRPSDCRMHRGEEGRTPLHVACDHDAPAVVIQALLQAFPDASVMVGTSGMSPLHITCSSHHASVHVVRVLLEGGSPEQFTVRDVDGDTPLHAACRCGAPFEVLEVLLRANPSVVHEKDFEDLTPLLRLWVRYFVILGDHVIESVNRDADLKGELLEAWNKTELLLRCAHYGRLVESCPEGLVFRAVHAASAVDCPRAIVRIATKVYPGQLDEKDEYGRTPLVIACQAPIFKIRDLSDDGYTLEDVIHGDETNKWGVNSYSDEAQEASSQPSVISILLQANPTSEASGACVPDLLGRLPLHLALSSGKSWKDGVKELVEAYPDAMSSPDMSSKLYPFMMAAEGWKGDTNTTFELLRHSPGLLDDLVLPRRCVQ